MKLTQLFAALCALPLMATAAVSFDAAEANRPAYANIAYVQGSSSGKAHALDIYLLSKRAKDMPLIVYIHGGGWKVGDKDFAGF